jgi:CRISPR-associated protein Cmr4
MDVNELLLYLYAESPVHAGAADSLGFLDLPVQREASTGYPVIWGQSLKGALRQAASEHPDWDEGRITAVFGSEVGSTDNEATTAGHLRVGDAQLVAMPVPTLRFTFTWVTSQIALGRLARKYRSLRWAEIPDVPSVAPDRGSASGEHWANSRGEVLGPCVVHLTPDPQLQPWADRLAQHAIGSDPEFSTFADKLKTDLVLVGSEIMPTLLRECTEQAVRVQLNDDKTVENGPFYSEYLPTETILAASQSLRDYDREDDAALDAIALQELLGGSLLQIGGDETLGKGLVWTRLYEGIQS